MAAASDSPFLFGLGHDPFMSTKRISLRVIELRADDFLSASDLMGPLELPLELFGSGIFFLGRESTEIKSYSFRIDLREGGREGGGGVIDRTRRIVIEFGADRVVMETAIISVDGDALLATAFDGGAIQRTLGLLFLVSADGRIGAGRRRAAVSLAHRLPVAQIDLQFQTASQRLAGSFRIHIRFPFFHHHQSRKKNSTKKKMNFLFFNNYLLNL